MHINHVDHPITQTFPQNSSGGLRSSAESLTLTLPTNGLDRSRISWLPWWFDRVLIWSPWLHANRRAKLTTGRKQARPPWILRRWRGTSSKRFLEKCSSADQAREGSKVSGTEARDKDKKHMSHFEELSRHASAYVPYHTAKVQKFDWGLEPTLRRKVIGLQLSTFAQVVSTTHSHKT